MSTMPAVRTSPVSAPQRPSPLRGQRGRQPSLVVVSPVGAASGNAGFALTCIGVLAAMMLGLLLLNVAISGNAFTLHELDNRSAVLADSQQALEQRLAAESAPASLAAKAAALGMVPAPETLVLAPGAAAED